MHPRRLFLASCLALIATAMAFSIRADIIPALKMEFALTDAEMGAIAGPGLWGFAITIALGGMLVDTLGMGPLLWFAFFGHVLGVVLTIFAQGYASLYAATLLIGLANGMVEAVANPLTATLFAENKTKYLNRLHAWWPGGLIVGGLLSYLITKAMGLDSAGTSLVTLGLGWKIKMSLILLPAAGYGYLILGERFPATERVASGVSASAMWAEARRPLFLLFVFLMMLTAATELGPDQWVGNLLQNLVGIQGILFLVYTAGIMFVLRHFFAGKLVATLGPLGVLTAASALSSLGLYYLSGADSALTVLAAATLFGIGKTFFWPTMLGVVAERFPKGGALLLGIMGAAGMFCVGWIMTPVMGKMQDRYLVKSLSPELRERVTTAGELDERKLMGLPHAHDAEVDHAKRYSATMTYRSVAVVPLALVAIFLGLLVYFRLQGGYRVVRLSPATS